MSKEPFYLLTGVLFTLQCACVTAGELLWFTDIPPYGSHGMRHSHGGPVEIRRGVYHKKLWLLRGHNPQDNSYLAQETGFSPLSLMDTEGRINERKIGRDKVYGLLGTTFPMPAEGFYNVYVSRQWVSNRQRRLQVVKAEILKHSCREGHDNVQDKMPPKYNAAIPLEIVRKRRPKEDFHSLFGHGDTATFTIMRNGKPLSGARVALFTAQGWSKKAISDSDGRVSYTMIRDYYPSWNMFNKRRAQPYVVSAEYRTPESGELDGRRYDSTLYRASFSDNYYPSPRDYESYAYGLMIGLSALAFSGLAIYLYRRRRKRPYREVRFDG